MDRVGAFLIAVLLLGAPAFGALDDLAARVVDAYGGPAAAEKYTAYRALARVQALLRGTQGKVVREFRAPDKLRVEITYPGTTEVRILNGPRGWRGDAGMLRRVTGLPLLAMEYQILRSAVPWVFTRYRQVLEDRGQRRSGGRTWRLVGLPWSMSLDVTYWVDPGTSLVLRVEGLLRAGGRTSVFATQYADFRPVEGVLFPFLEQNYASGRRTGATTVLTVTWNPPDLGPFDPTRTTSEP